MKVEFITTCMQAYVGIVSFGAVACVTFRFYQGVWPAVNLAILTALFALGFVLAMANQPSKSGSVDIGFAKAAAGWAVCLSAYCVGLATGQSIWGS